MSGALVRAQPDMAIPAREAWEHAGLRCAIVASPMGGWNGYVQLPPGSRWRRTGWLEVPDLGVSLTWGPDPDGWVGFDTGHATDAWAPDDDSPPYLPSWAAAAGFTLPPPAVLAEVAVLRRRLAASLPGHTIWTLPRLRAAAEQLAERLAYQGG
jgi:hypothetical protein